MNTALQILKSLIDRKEKELEGLKIFQRLVVSINIDHDEDQALQYFISNIKENT